MPRLSEHKSVPRRVLLPEPHPSVDMSLTLLFLGCGRSAKCFIHWACNEEGLNYPNIGTTVVGVHVITIMIIGVLFMITVRGRAYFREKRCEAARECRRAE